MTPGGGWDAVMRLALAEARAALATDDVPVGAVVVTADPGGALGAATPGGAEGQARPDVAAGSAPGVLAVAHNEREARRDPTAHAEVLALRRAAAATGSWRLEGCTLVVTLEPCLMCAGAIALARLPRLVYGAGDPKAGAAGSLWDVLRDPRASFRTEVISGVLAEESADLLRTFFRGKRIVR